MAFVNCGASDNYGRIKTKKYLREMVKDHPANVYLDSTAMFGDSFNGSLVDAPTQHTYQVSGPDPYHKRVWGASIKFVNGAWKVVA